MKTVHVPKREVDKTLKTPPVRGKNFPEPFKSFALQNKLPFSILEDTAISNDAEVHRHEADLWFCLQGEAMFVCGGSLVGGKCRLNKDGSENKNELFAARYRGR